MGERETFRSHSSIYMSIYEALLDVLGTLQFEIIISFFYLDSYNILVYGVRINDFILLCSHLCKKIWH